MPATSRVHFKGFSQKTNFSLLLWKIQIQIIITDSYRLFLSWGTFWNLKDANLCTTLESFTTLKPPFQPLCSIEVLSFGFFQIQESSGNWYATPICPVFSALDFSLSKLYYFLWHKNERYKYQWITELQNVLRLEGAREDCWVQPLPLHRTIP